MADCGDRCWCLARNAEGNATGEGTPLCVQVRQPGGRWYIHLCSPNEAAPAPV